MEDCGFTCGTVGGRLFVMLSTPAPLEKVFCKFFLAAYWSLVEVLSSLNFLFKATNLFRSLEIVRSALSLISEHLYSMSSFSSCNCLFSLFNRATSPDKCSISFSSSLLTSGRSFLGKRFSEGCAGDSCPDLLLPNWLPDLSKLVDNGEGDWDGRFCLSLERMLPASKVCCSIEEVIFVMQWK